MNVNAAASVTPQSIPIRNVCPRFMVTSEHPNIVLRFSIHERRITRMSPFPIFPYLSFVCRRQGGSVVAAKAAGEAMNS